MANKKHLAILREGVKAWNEWRAKNNVLPDLSNADLTDADLTNADLRGADLVGADLSNADLTDAELPTAMLIDADLTGANLTNADLTDADLTRADVTSAEFNGTVFGWTALGFVDLRQTKGLEKAVHRGPSSIGIETLLLSNGQIPEVFLRGAGVPETFITYMRSLTGRAFEFYTCFISYSSKDQRFAERLYADLQANGVRCWLASEDMKIGAKIRPSIDEAIRVHEKLLLVLSAKSIRSAWVEKEVETAFDREAREGRTILFPIRLDGTVMKTDEAWAADIRRTRHIGDFSKWKDYDAYKNAFDRMLRDLKTAGKGDGSADQ